MKGDLIERLRSVHQQLSGPFLVNPDGPEAADEIERLLAGIQEAIEWLEMNEDPDTATLSVLRPLLSVKSTAELTED